MNIKLTVSYDGTAYCGWQVQPNGISIQGEIERALNKLTGKDIKVTGSGRTDAGVHALGQVVCFDAKELTIPPQKFAKALNTFLPSDIRVLSSGQVDKSFHAIKSAKKKTYRYSVYLSDIEKPLQERYAVRVDGGLDFDKMQAVARLFVGEHDFKCACASGSGAKSTIRTIYDIQIVQKGNDVDFLVCGNGFLYNMVRIIVGTILTAGYGKISVECVKNALAGGERSLLAKTLPAKGLCLYSVEY